jgi:RimJ/RimL family protein N-acetyltransferase
MGIDAVQTKGILCESELLTIGWPDPAEFDQITSLRNLKYVRKWFLSDAPINRDRNREWLMTGMNRPYESLLTIRFKPQSFFLGMIGWSDWDTVDNSAWFGRLALDLRALRAIASQLPNDYDGVALDAARTLVDYAFEIMELCRIHTYYMAANEFAAQVNRSVGMVETGQQIRFRKDGTPIPTVELQLTRERWMWLRSSTTTYEMPQAVI